MRAGINRIVTSKTMRCTFLLCEQILYIDIEPSSV
jgi:hypothetical protein